MTLNDLECPIQLKVRMSHGLSADGVDTSLASLLYYYIVVKQMWCSVKCTISEWAKLTRCLSAVAELLVLYLIAMRTRIRSVERCICPIAAVCTVLFYCHDVKP